MDQVELHRQVVQALSDGIMVVRFDGTIQYANDACQQILGSETPLRGRLIGDFLDEQGREQAAGFLARAAGGDLSDGEMDSMFVTPAGEQRWVLLRELGLYSDDELAGVILQITDNRETKRLLDRLSESQEELEQAERIASLGSWIWDLRSGEVRSSRGLEDLFGPNTARILSQDLADVEEITHPEDHERLRGAIQTLRSREKPRVDVELRQLGEAGWMWVRMRALATYDRDGDLIAVSGTHQDITRARATEDQLQDQVTQNALMQAVASAANEATTLDDVLVQAQAMVILHDDWIRARAFVPDEDGELQPRYFHETDREADAEDAAMFALEFETARRSLATGAPTWDDEVRRTIATPIVLDDEVLAVVTITSAPPLYRHDMIRSMFEQAALQLSRVAERERAARELATTRDRALEASRHKSEFLATMSHEIRTPLNGIIGLTELLDRTALDSQQRNLTSGIAVSGRTLLGIINDILDFSKIEAGHLEVESVDFEVRDVFDQVAGVLASSARAKNLDLQVSCAPDVPEILSGDPVRLSQVLTNLGSNAVKFTSRGSVSMRATVERSLGNDTLLRVEVRDTGIGIDASEQRSIFRPFSQADTSTTRRFGGTGLGLAISAELVEAFGGQIGVESAPGEGSLFWFTARLRPPTGSRYDARLRRTREKLAHYRMLVVDDSVQNRLILSEQLSWWDMASTGVESVPDALSALTAAADAGDPFDGILLDLAMPDHDGLSLARRLRDDPRYSAVPVILLTSMNTPDADVLTDCGITEVLSKPVQAAALRDLLLRHVAGDRSSSHDEPVRDGHVLVVEDNPVNQVVAQGLLSGMGYSVDTADDGAQALSMTRSVRYDVVLMDLQMPRVDGYEATRLIRQRESIDGSTRVPIIAMTAAAIAGEREKCLAAGMDDFLAKPVAPAMLAEALQRWVPSSDETSWAPEAQPQTSAVPESTHLDLERLEMLRELSPDDNAYLDRVIDGFGSRSPEMLERLRDAVSTSDAAALSAEAHSVKGSALNIGLPTVSGFAAELEALGRSGDLVGSPDLLLRLEASVQDALEALSAYQEWYRSVGGS